MSILMLSKLLKPLMGTARIMINNLHIKGDLILMLILDGKTLLYSFVSIHEVRVGVAFGSGGSQSLPATEWPGVSSWMEMNADVYSQLLMEFVMSDMHDTSCYHVCVSAAVAITTLLDVSF
ncbi:hypothetical protein RYX36_035593 [Vicia faba]